MMGASSKFFTNKMSSAGMADVTPSNGSVPIASALHALQTLCR